MTAASEGRPNPSPEAMEFVRQALDSADIQEIVRHLAGDLGTEPNGVAPEEFSSQFLDSSRVEKLFDKMRADGPSASGYLKVSLYNFFRDLYRQRRSQMKRRCPEDIEGKTDEFEVRFVPPVDFSSNSSYAERVALISEIPAPSTSRHLDRAAFLLMDERTRCALVFSETDDDSVAEWMAREFDSGFTTQCASAAAFFWPWEPQVSTRMFDRATSRTIATDWLFLTGAFQERRAWFNEGPHKRNAFLHLSLRRTEPPEPGTKNRTNGIDKWRERARGQVRAQCGRSADDLRRLFPWWVNPSHVSRRKASTEDATS